MKKSLMKKFIRINALGAMAADATAAYSKRGV
jgi:hypothetical protein